MYLRLKFTAGSKHFDTSQGGKPISQWIREAISGVTAISALPSTAFDLSNCVVQGSLPTNITVSHNTISGTEQTMIEGNWLQFEKRHSQNDNFVNLFRIHQNSASNRSFLPRILSSNQSNINPVNLGATSWWHNAAENTGYMTHGLASVEFQFFISTHWVIWSTLDINGRGGTAGIYDVESTGQDVWARSLNALYSPQFFMSAHGQFWPSSSTPRVVESASERQRVMIGSLLMYNGDGAFSTRGFQGAYAGHHDFGRNVTPLLYPDVNTSFFATRDNIGDTQNYMMPVYFHTGHHTSILTPNSRATLNGRVPFLWRTTDNAAQTGQAATVGGVEYRFVRMHGCGSITINVADTNAATYMVPTLIGGI